MLNGFNKQDCNFLEYLYILIDVSKSKIGIGFSMKFSIIGEEKIIDFLGYWPKFCDAKLRGFCFDRNESSSFRVKIFYIDSDQMKSVFVEILFDDIFDLELNHIFNENVLDELVIDGDNADALPKYKVNFDSCYGMHGSFYCRSVEVVSAQCKMWRVDGEPR